jgi:hypothetical protein
MDRFQIYIPTPMMKALREIAEEQGVPVAEIIRRMLQEQLKNAK